MIHNLNRLRLTPAVLLVTMLLMVTACQVSAYTFAEDFESLTIGESTPPEKWSLITVDASPAYYTTNGASGAGKGGAVFGNHDANGSGIPGGYITHTGMTPLLATKNITGNFDFYVTEVGNYSSAIFFMGDVGDGLTETDPGEYISAVLTRNTFANGNSIGNGVGAQLFRDSGHALSSANWYSATFTWTPTNGLSGIFSFAVDGPHTWTNTYAGFTFSSPIVYVAFGAAGYFAVDHTGIFDNFSATGAALTPPGTVIILR